MATKKQPPKPVRSNSGKPAKAVKPVKKAQAKKPVTAKKAVKPAAKKPVKKARSLDKRPYCDT